MAMPGKHYHAVQFYKDEQSLAATVAHFLGEGLAEGQPGLVIATPTHTDAVVRELTARGLSVDALRSTGELQFFDARKMLESFMIGSMPDPMLFRSNVGDVIESLCAGRMPCPIRAYGEMVDLLWQEGNADGAIKLEILWNQLASAHDFALLCGYAFGHFYKETRDLRYEQVRDVHSHVVPAAAS
jgi:MEDS: MEthanogen/methylotroph, DcmR Sensory domain